MIQALPRSVSTVTIPGGYLIRSVIEDTHRERFIARCVVWTTGEIREVEAESADSTIAIRECTRKVAQVLNSRNEVAA